ncbi:MAG: hypothetical protein HJHJAOHD_00797 [Flavobacteriales bacterium]|nr:hypothetical protein [Flavobacteriales bacterium]
MLYTFLSTYKFKKIQSRHKPKRACIIPQKISEIKNENKVFQPQHRSLKIFLYFGG